MSDASKVRMTGPLALYASDFTAELWRQGYKPNAAPSAR